MGCGPSKATAATAATPSPAPAPATVPTPSSSVKGSEKPAVSTAPAPAAPSAAAHMASPAHGDPAPAAATPAHAGTIATPASAGAGAATPQHNPAAVVASPTATSPAPAMMPAPVSAAAAAAAEEPARGGAGGAGGPANGVDGGADGEVTAHPTTELLASIPNEHARVVETPVADEVQGTVARAASAGGVKGVTDVLALMKEKEKEPEYQWWCCDALAGLCAGNELARSTLYANNGINTILSAMKLYSWEENVQVKGNWLLAILAATYAEHLGKQGVVDIIVGGMRANPESYQVLISGTRCLQNLITGHDANRARAKAAGAEALMSEALDKNPEDGQLQYRGTALLAKLQSMTEEGMKALLEGEGAGAGAAAGGGKWRALQTAVRAGQARSIAAGNIPGFHGVSAQVAERARRGIVEVVELMRERPHSSEVAKWCCDAIATIIYGSPESRDKAHAAGALPLIVQRMREHTWDEELVLKACWALLAFAPTHAAEIGELGAISALTVAMFRSKTNHDVQVAAVKLLSLLTLEPTKNNLRLAREANAIRIVKSVIQAHTDDGQLQYRGINLLERLQPGVTASMPKVNMIRSASMRVEEMVVHTRSMARIASTRSTPATSRHASPEEEARANAAAIAEVDDIAEAVEDESSDDDEHGGGKRGGHGKKKRASGVAADGTTAAAATAAAAAAAAVAAPEPAPTAASTATGGDDATSSNVTALTGDGAAPTAGGGGGGGGKTGDDDAGAATASGGGGRAPGEGINGGPHHHDAPSLPGSVDTPSRHASHHSITHQDDATGAGGAAPGGDGGTMGGGGAAANTAAIVSVGSASPREQGRMLAAVDGGVPHTVTDAVPAGSSSAGGDSALSVVAVDAVVAGAEAPGAGAGDGGSSSSTSA